MKKKYFYFVLLGILLLTLAACAPTTPNVSNTPPEPPSNLSAEALSSTEIKLTWTDNSNNEEGFKIERKTEGTDWAVIETIEEANIEEYTDSGLNPNTTYYYRVRAYNSAGDSNYSEETTVTTPDVPPNNNGVPTAPSNLQAQALSSSQIKLTWTDNSNNEEGFKIERKTEGTDWAVIETIEEANIEEYTDSGLSPNTTYYYRVRAYNSVGESSYSNEEHATTEESEEPSTEVWQKTYGGSDDDGALSIQQTEDGGYVVGGYTYSFGAGGADDVYVIKLDSNGNKKWEKTYGGSGYDYDRALSIQQTEDGGYVVAGVTTSFGAGESDVYVIKLDSEGNKEWQKTYGGSDGDVAYSIQQTEDGGYVVGGYTESFGAGGADVYVIKLDSEGNKEWEKTYGGSGYDRALSIQQTEDGGYVVAGYTNSFGAGGFDVYIIKTDTEGNTGPQP